MLNEHFANKKNHFFVSEKRYFKSGKKHFISHTEHRHGGGFFCFNNLDKLIMSLKRLANDHGSCLQFFDCTLKTPYLVSVIWNILYPAIKEASRVRDCLPEPPTPTRRAFPHGVRMIREI